MFKTQFHLEKRMTSQKREEREFQLLYKIIGIVESKIREELIKVQCLIPMLKLMMVKTVSSKSKLII
jgi:hypothetical protein